jgi:diguanylate cyclase (GGDEF)-like protein
MKLLKKADQTLLTVLLTVALTILFCLILWFFLENQIDLMKKGYINGTAKSNEYIVNQVKSKITNEAGNEQEVIDIVKAEQNTGTRYWMLFSSEGALFERDAEITGVVAGMDFEELEKYYLRNGGDGAGPLIDLIQAGEFFSADVVKDVTAGNELISAGFVTVDGRTYCVATSILESYLFSSAKIGERIMLLRILFLAMSALLVSLVTYLVSSRRSVLLQLQNLRDELKEKNLLVLEHNGDGSQNGDDSPSNPVSSTDPLTGLYSNAFFETLLHKLSRRGVNQIGAVVVRMSNYYEVSATMGVDYADQALVSAAAIIKSHAETKDFCARIRTQEFALIKLESTDKLTLQTAKKIFHDLREIDSDAKYVAGFAFKDDVYAIDTVMESAWISVKKL